MTTVHETITNSKAQLDKLLSNRYVEDSLLLGSLSFTQNKMNNFISQDLSAVLNQASEQADSDYNSNELLDALWLDFHYPVIKYFQSHFKSYKKHNKTNPVEMRRLFDNFHKFIKTFNDFYSQLIQKLLSSYDLSKFIPAKILYEWFDIVNFENQQELDVQSAASGIVYLIYKSTLSMADLSRYRSMVAKEFLPAKSLTKKDADFSVSINLYKLCILILPSFGDPYDHIAIIDNSINDKFNVVYNFLRSSMTRIPSTLGLRNLINLCTVAPTDNVILKEYKRINTIDDPNKINTLELLKLQFLCLFSYHFLPQYWKSKDGVLVNGVPVKDLENAFFDNLEGCNFKGKPLYSELLFKQLIMLMSGLHVLTDKVGLFENDKLIKDSKIIGVFLKFFFKFLKQTFQIILDNWREHASENLDLPLLSIFRMILNWLKHCKLGYQYLRHNTSVLYKLCELLNFEYGFMKQHEGKIATSVQQSNPDFLYQDLSSIISTKFKRARFFKEDISLKEFTPIGNHMSDFQDSYMFIPSEENSLRLIGKLTQEEFEKHHSSRIVENSLRLAATGRLGKMLVTTSIKNADIGLKFNSIDCIFEMNEALPNASEHPKKEKSRAAKSKKKSPKTEIKKRENIKEGDSNKGVKNTDEQEPQKPILKVKDKTLERIQATIQQYQQQHSQEDDILSLIKKSHENSASSSASPQVQDKMMSLTRKSSTPSDQADDERSYSNMVMVSNLLEEHDSEYSNTIKDSSKQDPQQPNTYQTTLQNNFWSTAYPVPAPVPVPASYQHSLFSNHFPIPQQNQFALPQQQQQLPAHQQEQFQPFQVTDTSKRQFFGQGAFNTNELPPPLPPIPQQNMYAQYFGEPPVPLVNPPIQQHYQQYPPFYTNSPAPADEAQHTQAQAQGPKNIYSQYGHFGL